MRILFLIASLLLATPAFASQIAGTATVIDGDTIEVHGQRIRLHGIDAPEGRQRCYRGGQPWRCGTVAANALAELIGRNPVTCEVLDVDRYGRAVARCSTRGVDVGQWMVAEGWAMAYRYFSRSYVPDEDSARRARRGIWSSEFQAPWDWRRSRR